MDMSVLKKKLSTFRSETGRLMNVSDDLLFEILIEWERWAGPAQGFYAALGVDHRKMAKLIGRAKKLKREGVFPADSFKEIQISEGQIVPESQPCQGIEVFWEKGRVIRFKEVSALVEFLKKAA